MRGKSGLITIWMSFGLILLSAGLVSHVMSIPVILGIAQRDSWIAVIIAAPVFLVWMLLIYIIINRLDRQRLPDWIERRFGRFASWLFRLSAVLVLLVSAVCTLNDTSMWTVTTYMQQTPMFVLVLAAAATAMLAAFGGIRSIALTSSILLPFVLLLGYFVMLSNTKYKDYSLLFPVLEEGWGRAFKAAFYVLAGLFETWILLLYQHNLDKKIKWWHLMLLGLFMLGMVFGPTVGAISEFGPIEAAKQRHTAFEQWKILSLGMFLQHVDFLSIYQWICGSFTRVAISLYLAVDMLDIRKPPKRMAALCVITALMIAATSFFWRDDMTLDYLQKVHMPFMFFYVAGITLLLLVLLAVRGQPKEGRTDEAIGSGTGAGQKEGASGPIGEQAL